MIRAAIFSSNVFSFFFGSSGFSGGAASSFSTVFSIIDAKSGFGRTFGRGATFGGAGFGFSAAFGAGFGGTGFGGSGSAFIGFGFGSGGSAGSGSGGKAATCSGGVGSGLGGGGGGVRAGGAGFGFGAALRSGSSAMISTSMTRCSMTISLVVDGNP